MTLQEAKQSIAIKYEGGGYLNFNRLFGKYEPEHVAKLMDEAAELYARFKWEQACHEQIIEANKHSIKLHGHVLLEVPRPKFKK